MNRTGDNLYCLCLAGQRPVVLLRRFYRRTSSPCSTRMRGCMARHRHLQEFWGTRRSRSDYEGPRMDRMLTGYANRLAGYGSGDAPVDDGKSAGGKPGNSTSTSARRKRSARRTCRPSRRGGPGGVDSEALERAGQCSRDHQGELDKSGSILSSTQPT